MTERQEDGSEEYERMQNFLSAAFDLLDRDMELFLNRYEIAAVVWMQAMMPPHQKDETIKRGLASRAEGVPFRGLYRQLRMPLKLLSSRNQEI